MLKDVLGSNSVPKSTYAAQIVACRNQLYDLQVQARDAGLPFIVLLEGWDAAGKGTTVRALTRQLDPRGFKLHPIRAARTYEKNMPWLWRFWRRIPSRGELAIFDHSWYGRVLVERVEGLAVERQWRRAYEDILSFEEALLNDGYAIFKFFLHIHKKEQRRRFRKLMTDPLTSWQVTRDDWDHHRKYDEYYAATEEMLMRTHTARSPWHLVDATDARYRSLEVFRTVISGLEARLNPQANGPTASGTSALTVATPAAAPAPGHRRLPASAADISLLGDPTHSLTREQYDQELLEHQVALRLLAHQAYLQRRPVVIVFEGWDAAGKGGTIKRLTERLDPRGYVVHAIGKPLGEDATRHYLWRFWARLPELGQIAIFDRSWYGRVLVERVEGFCSESDWRRAYHEIVQFEQQLQDFGAILLKFWMNISQDEQLRRFEDRSTDGMKHWKLTDEDWRNRGKWDDYEHAVRDMIRETSTAAAPWTVVDGNFKWYARVKVLRTVRERLSEALDFEPSFKRPAAGSKSGHDQKDSGRRAKVSRGGDQ
ncbi:MAG: hypothetical protein HYV63_29950 [Candidatus Schekmanbacteria bacterium]|nr:hypothetical protein [Candidatus Schekmanbacteria bacterium]